MSSYIYLPIRIMGDRLAEAMYRPMHRECFMRVNPEFDDNYFGFSKRRYRDLVTDGLVEEL
jgi:hypothetical protein